MITQIPAPVKPMRESLFVGEGLAPSRREMRKGLPYGYETAKTYFQPKVARP